MLYLNIISTIILDLTSVVFAGLYIWMNTFSRIDDIESRNEVVVRVVKTTMILAVLFAFLSCVLADEESFYNAIMSTHYLYIFISVSWILILVCFGIAGIYQLLTKEYYRVEKRGTYRKMLKIAICGALLGTGMVWLIG